MTGEPCWSCVLHGSGLFSLTWLSGLMSRINWNPNVRNISLIRKGANQKEGVNLLKDHDTTWWCPDYNKQSCTISASSHQKHIKLRTVWHFCSACFRADKLKLKRPHNSSACPYFKKWQSVDNNIKADVQIISYNWKLMWLLIKINQYPHTTQHIHFSTYIKRY